MHCHEAQHAHHFFLISTEQIHSDGSPCMRFCKLMSELHISFVSATVSTIFRYVWPQVRANQRGKHRKSSADYESMNVMCFINRWNPWSSTMENGWCSRASFPLPCPLLTWLLCCPLRISLFGQTLGNCACCCCCCSQFCLLANIAALPSCHCCWTSGWWSFHDLMLHLSHITSTYCFSSILIRHRENCGHFFFLFSLTPHKPVTSKLPIFPSFWGF